MFDTRDAKEHKKKTRNTSSGDISVKFVPDNMRLGKTCSDTSTRSTNQDREALEMVQRRAIGMVSNLGRGSYKEKLEEVEMLSLVDKRERGT